LEIYESRTIQFALYFLIERPCISDAPADIKEHVAITIFASTAAHSALAISIFAADDLYYRIQPNVAIGIFTLIGSQLMGYGLGGILRISTLGEHPLTTTFQASCGRS
jgi:hypothetical protein